MNIVLGIIVGLLVLMALIVGHEFGHFIIAKRNGVRVKEFGIGFPPRIKAWLHIPPKDKNGKWTWKKLSKEEWDKDQNSLVFSLNALPIGGFCAMDGESDDDERPKTFGSASYWSKTKILFAGVTMNWLIAFVILTILCWTGLPAIVDHQFTIKSDERVTVDSPVVVEEVLSGSPAETAGFQSGDIILKESERDVVVPTDVANRSTVNPGDTIEYTVKRIVESCCKRECDCEYDPSQDREETITLTATLADGTENYLLGVTMSRVSTTANYTWSAPVVAAGLTVQLTGETFKGLWNLLVNLITGAARQISTDSSVREEGKEQISDATANVSGIVGIIGGYFPNIISAGPTYIFLFMAVISISLACMNVLPIPALDGGRWLMITLARLRHKKLSKEKEQKIVARAFIFLLILMAIITVIDIIRLF